MEVRDLKIDEVGTPSYQISSNSATGRKKPINTWLEVRSEYRVSKDWIDSAQFKYYVAMEAKDPKHLPADSKRPINILTGDVTYEDIPKGTSHLSTMYLTPTKFFRFGKVIGFRVEVLVGGQPVDMKEKVDARLKATPDWHKKPGKRILLNRSLTPFSPIDRDSFNDIKVETGR